MRWRFLALAMLLGAVGCGGSNSCVVDTSQGGYCREDLDPDECSNLSDSHTSPQSCESLGYTKRCPGETFAFRMPSYSC